MYQSDKNPNRLLVIPKWSELCPDLLRSIFKQLSLTNLNRAKSVCRSWNSASRGCVPKRNQIPWLILFPRENETNNSNSCSLFIPDDNKVYKTRDLGVDFARSLCLATYGSWFLMFDYLCNDLYILNPLTLERIDLPHSPSHFSPHDMKQCSIACLWIDNISKDYLVVWIVERNMVFTKKNDDIWRDVHVTFPSLCKQVVYSPKDHKVYIYFRYDYLYVWDFSSDIPRKDKYGIGFCDECYTLDQKDYRHGSWIQITTTVPAKLLHVGWILRGYKTWQFDIHEFIPLKERMVKINSLGDEALILDMGFTVVAKDIPGIRKNSIYFSDRNHPTKDTDLIYVYDLTTQTIETLPQCVFSSMLFSDARWFLPGFTC